MTAALPLLFALSASSPETPATSEAATSEGASATEAEDEAGAGKRKSGQAAVGAHWLFAANKAMPGVSLRVAERLVALDLETSLIWVTERDEAFDATFLGSQFGFYLSLRPLHGKRGELLAGLGSDVYGLWNIHGDEWEASLSLRVAGHAWLGERFGIFATARAYPLSTSGLELGATRQGSRGLPILLGLGVEWRLQ